MFKYIVLALILSFSFASSDDNQAPELGGIWFWSEPASRLGSSQILANTKTRQETIDMLLSSGFKRLYGEYSSSDFEQIAEWNKLLRQNGIEPQLLLTDNYWISPCQQSGVLERLEIELIYFNMHVDSESRFDAIHLNLEPHALDIWKEGSPELRRILLEQLQNTIAVVKQVLTDWGQNEVKIVIDLPVWYDNLNSTIAWKDAADRDLWFLELGSLVDGIVLMAYARNYQEVIESCSWELENVSSIISIALDADFARGGFWHSKQEFLETAQKLSNYYRGIVGIDIHSYLSFFE